jgi:hypothetical protein
MQTGGARTAWEIDDPAPVTHPFAEEA